MIDKKHNRDSQPLEHPRPYSSNGSKRSSRISSAAYGRSSCNITLSLSGSMAFGGRDSMMMIALRPGSVLVDCNLPGMQSKTRATNLQYGTSFLIKSLVSKKEALLFFFGILSAILHG